MSQFFSAEFLAWLNQHATEIDQSNQYADELFQRIANEGVFKIIKIKSMDSFCKDDNC